MHWRLGYQNTTGCGILAYATNWEGEFDTAVNGRIECTILQKNVTCKNCKRAMMIGDPYDNRREGAA